MLDAQVTDSRRHETEPAAAIELLILVPTFNERKNVPGIVDGLDRTLKGVSWKVVFVDDNSPDGTVEAVRALARTDPRIQLISRHHRRGLSSAVVEGAFAAAAEVIVVMDGDRQHDETVLPVLYKTVRDGGADIASASRFLRADGADGPSSERRLRISNAIIRMANVAFGLNLTDPLTCFFAMRRGVLEQALPGLSESGFKLLVDRLESDPRAAGAEIRLGAPVQNVSHDAATEEVVVVTEAGESRFDRVLATVPSNVFTWMIDDRRQSDPDYFRRLESIDYLDAAVQVFATKQKFTPYCWHNISTPNAPFVVFLSLTNLVGTERYDGLNIYYIVDYVPREHEYMQMEPEALKSRWYDELGKIFPEFDREQVVDDAVFRLRSAQHIVDLGFEENKLTPYETPCPGVLLCNFSQIYPMDRGTNYAVHDGNEMAACLAESLRERRRGASATAAPAAASRESAEAT